MSAGAPPFVPSFDPYPLRVEFTAEDRESRLWGIPLLGMLARVIALIPSLIGLWAVGIVAGVLELFLWIPVLLFGRYPAIGFQLIGGYVRWAVRVSAYALLMPGGYPPFSLTAEHPTRVEFDERRDGMNRLWGIPFVGIALRAVLLLPHFLALWVLGIVGWLGLFVLWFPILTTGRFPSWGMTLYGGLLRWQTRVQAYLLMMPVPYPPFRLTD